MYDTYAKVLRVNVALRKESVDRNITFAHLLRLLKKSLSARRAWIEITILSIRVHLFFGRSPQGERG